jgi:hypothetical protein
MTGQIAMTNAAYLGAFTGAAILLDKTLSAMNFGMWEIRSSAEETGVGGAPRGPDDDDYCWRAKLRKRRAKQIVEQLGQCQNGMFATQRVIRGMAYLELGLARGNETRACFGGRWDSTHQNEQDHAFANAMLCAIMSIGSP